MTKLVYQPRLWYHINANVQSNIYKLFNIIHIHMASSSAEMSDLDMADHLFKRAEKAARPGFIARMTGDIDTTEAVDLFRRAACFYSMAKEHGKAARTFTRAAGLCTIQPAALHASAASAHETASEMGW